MRKRNSVKRRPTNGRQLSKTADANVSSAFFALCKNVNTPHSLAIWLCYKYDHMSMVELSLEPADYGDNQLASLGFGKGPLTFAYDLAVHEYLSKYKGLKLDYNTRKEAIRNFDEAESHVATINRKLMNFRTAQTPRLEAIILIARRKISEVLGLRRDATFSFGWGPGATFSIKGDVGWDRKILEKRISVTASACDLASLVIGSDIHWCRARGIDADGPCSLLRTEFVIVPGNRITTVHKNAKTDRTIAIEPTANIYLQKGVGSWIRRRLKSVARIDLNSQYTNQKYAGRLDYATIDLKAASDSVSEQVVRLLLPEEWVFLLDIIRSPNYQFGKCWYRYQKWSSMGNGYTFELETLVFWALGCAVQTIDSGRYHVICYGDDILVPVEHAESTIACLEVFGFSTNLKKTHFKSLYRESCGVHFFDQQIVTPVYQKEVPIHVGEVYHMANRLRHLASRLGGHHYSDKIVRNAWLAVLRALGPKIAYSPFVVRRPYVDHKTGQRPKYVESVNYSLDGTIHMSIEDCLSLGHPLFSWGSKERCLATVTKKREFDQAAGLCFTLMKDSTFEGEEVLSIRGRSANRWRRKRVYRSFGSNIWL